MFKTQTAASFTDSDKSVDIIAFYRRHKLFMSFLSYISAYLVGMT